MKSASNGGIHKGRLQCFMYMYFLLPHWVLAIWRSRVQTSMRAELPSRKLPTTRVRRRISRFSRSMTLMGDFTHPWVGQAERLACCEWQPTQFPGGSPDPLCGQRSNTEKRRAALPVASIAMPLTRKSCPGPSGARTSTTPVCPCEPLCGPITGGAESLPLPADTGRIWAVVHETAEREFSSSGRFLEDKKYSRIKAGVAVGASGRSQLPAVRAVTGSFRCIKSGVKNMTPGLLLGSFSRNA